MGSMMSAIFQKIYERLRQKDADGRYPDIVLGSRFMEGSSDFPVSVTKNWHMRCSAR